VIKVIFGTVASEKAYSNLAPCFIIPPNSCSVPGKNPGTSTKVTNGRLKASQNRTKRAALTDELMSKTPARWAGWLATMPTGFPPKRTNPTIIFWAYCAWTSKKCLLSITFWIISCMSYGLFGSAGTISCRLSSTLSDGSTVGFAGGSSRLFEGRKLNNSRTIIKVWSSSFPLKCATPLFELWVVAPPSSSFVTSSWVTVLITSGPVTNMWLFSLTIKIKSVRAGEYTAPPAHGPSIAEIWGITPDDITLL